MTWLPLDDSYLNASPHAKCARCHRSTWSETVGAVDIMPQPDGGICGGLWIIQ